MKVRGFAFLCVALLGVARAEQVAEGGAGNGDSLISVPASGDPQPAAVSTEGLGVSSNDAATSAIVGSWDITAPTSRSLLQRWKRNQGGRRKRRSKGTWQQHNGGDAWQAGGDGGGNSGGSPGAWRQGRQGSSSDNNNNNNNNNPWSSGNKKDENPWNGGGSSGDGLGWLSNALGGGSSPWGGDSGGQRGDNGGRGGGGASSVPPWLERRRRRRENKNGGSGGTGKWNGGSDGADKWNGGRGKSEGRGGNGGGNDRHEWSRGKRSGGRGGGDGVSGGLSGSAQTTRYWDCAKPSCAWQGKSSAGTVACCAKDGVTRMGADARSGVDGGDAFVCNSMQPWAVSSSLSYGFAAFAGGGGESRTCCMCVELAFTSGAVAGKRMVVQVINTGYDLAAGSQFDLQIPAGGVGAMNACKAQHSAGSDWGAAYGGVSAAHECSNLPAALRDGCEWRFDWFENADNPSATFREVGCPSALTARSGCSR